MHPLSVSRVAIPFAAFSIFYLAGGFLSNSAASSSNGRLMFVVSKHLPGITIYDADSGKPVCRGNTGISPHEAAFSLDGRYVYVPVYGNSGVGKPGTDEHMLHVFQTSDCKEVGSLDTGEYKRPHAVTVGRQ